MKNINQYITEKLKIYNKKYTLFPKSNSELRELILKEIENNGYDCDLNHIDVSNITDMSSIFYNCKFNGDISDWDVSNVENMAGMFFYSDFNGDISMWDVSNVTTMDGMFENSNFNGDISKWDVFHVVDMSNMFFGSVFNQDISNWKINPNCRTIRVFTKCPIRSEYVPKKNGQSLLTR